VNEKIFANLPVRAYWTTLEEARNLGAMMLFGEKYGDEVRVVEVDGWSRELCGGTHVRSTAEIGPFVILSESSVGAGARRIEAVTAGEAFALLAERAHEADVLRGEIERLKKEARKRPAAQEAEADVSILHEDGTLVVVEVKGMAGGPLRDLSDRIKQQRRAGVVLVGATDDGRASLVLNVDEPLVAKGVHAGELIRDLAKTIGGGGGGRPTLAEAGGKNPEKLGEALDAGRDTILALLA
jgi:alanyl-tRNA synthetase